MTTTIATGTSTTAATEPGDVAGALDLMLTDAALGTARRLLPGRSTARFVGALARRPRPTAGRAADLAAELSRIALGASPLAPSPRDRRFADPAWTQNPALRRIVQAYLAAGRIAESLVADADLGWRDAERVGFLVTNLVQAAAPSNNPLISPVAWKAAIDSGGASVVNGVRHLVGDMLSAPRVPTMVAPDAYRVGADLACTPGEVVLRTALFELIQYAPRTETVHAVPLLMVPPTINKYYVMDLAPGRSMIEYFVGQGQQVFVMSWRNPDTGQRAQGMDAYGQAVLDALDAACAVTGSDRAHLLGTCSGGIIATQVAAHLAAVGADRLASLTLLVTMLDQERAGTAGALVDEPTARAAIAASRARGYLDGRTLAEVFAWLRPGDLIWNYWVNNYLQGRTPPAFDILFWNADTTRMTAALHRDFVTLAMDNALVRPGAATMLGTPVDLGAVTVDTYVVAGGADHICPWRNCYASTRLLGGATRFVLSTNGHIAALVNPPENRKSSFQVGADPAACTPAEHPADPDTWAAAARTEPGSWWTDYTRWLAERSGPRMAAPTTLGGPRHTPLEAAPGSYVLET